MTTIETNCVDSKQFAAEINVSWAMAKKMLRRAEEAGEGWVTRGARRKLMVDLAGYRKAGAKHKVKQRNPRRRSGRKARNKRMVDESLRGAQLGGDKLRGRAAGKPKARRQVVVTAAKGDVAQQVEDDAKAARDAARNAAAEARAALEALGDESVDNIAAHIRNAEAALNSLGESMRENPDEYASAFKDISTELRQLRSHLREEKAASASIVQREVHEEMLESIAQVTELNLNQLARTLPTHIIGDITAAGVTIPNTLAKKVMTIVKHRCELEVKNVLAQMADTIEEARSREAA